MLVGHNIARSISSIGDNDSESNDDNIQWEEPLIFRFNGTEYKVFVYYGTEAYQSQL
jgi:hypothetical protein